MYRKISDFISNWSFESGATLKVFKTLTDESLNQKVTPEGRSLGQISWHITQSLPQMLGRANLEMNGKNQNAPVPDNTGEIISEYKRLSAKVAEQVKANWSDEELNDEIDMFGQKWEKGKVLASLVSHQAHHRAQMTVLMRQAGLKVPGIYGPSKEEWALMGIPPQE
jgi:uncharacterized damage-inducible protein DinB